MSDHSSIEWTDATWNPVTGCTKVSPGCDHCYAERLTERFNGKGSFAEVRLHPDRLDQPLRWKKPRRVFVNSMSDLFHPDVPDSFIREVFDRMRLCDGGVDAVNGCPYPQHTFQVLTKRPRRMLKLVHEGALGFDICPPHIWLGVSVEDQKWAANRIPLLIATAAEVRFLSCEPLLGPIDLSPWVEATAQLHWVIVGGESGPGARAMHEDWVRSLRDQCVTAGVAFFFKQWGGFTPKAGGRTLDGVSWDQWPSAMPDLVVLGESLSPRVLI